MDQKPITLIVSDLHMGDGSAADDFVDDSSQFANFVKSQADTEAGQAGRIELVINGDFLEFVQVLPEAYTLDSTEYWCSEPESLAKLERILTGHPKVFTALAEFEKRGNRVTLFPGNHDVDLYWGAVQQRLRTQIPGLNIEAEPVKNWRYGGRLMISHGHLFPSIDPANGFEHWGNPILSQTRDADPKRLEMCPGTLFVVRFVNWLEARYPFADNLRPETALAGILAREDRWGFTAVSWALARFAARYRKATLSTEPVADIGPQLLNAVQGDRFLRERIVGVYRDVLGMPDMTADKIRQALGSDDDIAAFIERLLQAGPSWEIWIEVLDMAKPGVLGIGEPGGTLTIHAAGKIDVRAECLKIAKNHWDVGAEIVVFGHTHLPQEVEGGCRRYYNPGSWTRYVENAGALRLDDLRDESRFPYRLNCVRVEAVADGSLRSELICVDRRPAA